MVAGSDVCVQLEGTIRLDNAAGISSIWSEQGCQVRTHQEKEDGCKVTWMMYHSSCNSSHLSVLPLSLIKALGRADGKVIQDSKDATEAE